MAGKIKVELLVKDELTFELLGRNIQTFTSESTVKDLRKLLRTHQEVPFEAKFLDKRISVTEELNFIECKLTNLSDYLSDIDSTKISKILRGEAKLAHLEQRCKALQFFKCEDASKALCAKLLADMEQLKAKLTDLTVEQSVKDSVYRKLSDSMLQEEELDEVFENSGEPVTNNSNDMSTSQTKTEARPSVNNVPFEGVQNTSTVNPVVNTEHNASSLDYQFCTELYSKLQNPIDKYLKLFKITNGLNVDELLNFIKVCLQLHDDMQISSKLILDLCVSYANGPLLAKILEVKRRKGSFGDLHKELLNCFIPINMRDNLRRDFVNRPQKENEPLSLYISDVKFHAKLFLCNYSEYELVTCIKLGINPNDRSKLTFVSEPKTFIELESMCMQAQNVQYNDYVRNNSKANSRKYVNNVMSNEPNEQGPSRPRPVCYRCNKVGHIMRYCRTNMSSYSNPKNY
ncbi:MAG: hypothetical protein E6K54_08405 [Gammaproteobacteria bacterium]|nr:MAG: hypothetical protein E6K54_08405 [Gammaproteobacteria bacterium]